MPSEFEKKIRTEDASGIVQMIKDAHTVRKVIEWPGVPSVKVQMRLLSFPRVQKEPL